ncbi:MAG: AAA family ATPase, partial [Nanoarchaeota archaeon]
MLLKKITLENIRSYEHQEVEFPKGFTLLSGDIGSGKTSILLAIEFALFGLQPGQKGASLLRNGSENGRVAIELEVDNNNIFIERSLKKAKTISQDNCSITINGEKKDISVLELKNQVLEILNYPKEFSKKQNILYKFTVYTPQEEMKQIILQDPETRINTLRHVFGIDKYKKVLENTAIISLRLREERRMKEGATINLEQDRLSRLSKENDLETKYSNLSSIERELFLKKDIRKKIQEEKEEISKKIEERDRLRQEVEKTKIIIFNKKETLLGNTKTIERIKLQIKELNSLKFDESKILSFEKEIILLKKEKDFLNEKNLEISSKIASIKSKNEDNKGLEKKISSFEICPTCLQNVESVYRANVLNKLHSDTVDNNK